MLALAGACPASAVGPVGEDDSSSDSVAGVARRRAELPKVAVLSRGRFAMAGRVASDPEALDAALVNYEQEVRCENFRRSLKSKF
eukprot:6461524-Amphidinium_carterae.1